MRDGSAGGPSWTMPSLINAMQHSVGQSSMAKHIPTHAMRSLPQSCVMSQDSPIGKYVTHMFLDEGFILELPDGLSHHLTTIGVRRDFKYTSEWHGQWQ
jgi:hypothetical protein